MNTDEELFRFKTDVLTTNLDEILMYSTKKVIIYGRRQ